ncbi:Osteoclast-stimulating factor 1 [Lamellibrachia satsuma]|nr:Osteoclast-stimulating factor 1 [Lamellibrachia satsuma]
MSGLTPARPAPPKPRKPGLVKVVRSMYRYEAQQSDELTFDEGETLYILDMSDPNWWKAKCGNKTGLIPSNYVEANTEVVDFPIHEAAKRGNVTFMKECIANKVSVNGLDKAGSTPLHWAAHGGHMECMEMLLTVPNCEINVQNKLGDTPLHSAAWKGHAHAVELLLEKGAHTDLKNQDGKTASVLAKNPETAAILQQACQPRIVSNDYGDEDDSD